MLCEARLIESSSAANPKYHPSDKTSPADVNVSSLGGAHLNTCSQSFGDQCDNARRCLSEPNSESACDAHAAVISSKCLPTRTHTFAAIRRTKVIESYAYATPSHMSNNNANCNNICLDYFYALHKVCPFLLTRFVTPRSNVALGSAIA